MKIHYKGLVVDRFDAPFLGTLWIAPDCHHNCRGCCNQELKEMTTIVEDGEDIIKKIKDNPFSEGIILAGLDPLTYPDEAIHLIGLALESNLKVILYTALPDRASLLKKAPGLEQYANRGVYVKYGKYDDTKLVVNYESHSVPLASSNQYIEIL